MAYWPNIEGPRAQGGPQYQSWRQMGLNEMLLDNRIIFLDLPLDPLQLGVHIGLLHGGELVFQALHLHDQ